MANTTNKKFVCVDGNTAAAYVGYALSEVAAIYPITPSTTMAELCDDWAAKGQKNIWGDKLKIVEMQSEAGAAGAVHGSLQAGALTTTFTASQGLLLMIPNMYKIAGELLPSVFHVSARTLATHALNIFGDHSDVMSTRQTGFALLASNNVQEVMDMSIIAHMATLESSVPFLHFFEGFRTSHEISKIEEVTYESMRRLINEDAIKKFRKNAHSPNNPKTTGTTQNPDIFFQNREACNPFYDNVYDIVVKAMDKFAHETGRQYQPFQYHGPKDATHVAIAIGSGNDTLIEAAELLNEKGHKCGVLSVHLFRPFNADALIAAIPSSTKVVSVLDRTKEPGALADPLFLDIATALNISQSKIKCIGGRYALGGKDFTTLDAVSVFENSFESNPKNHFTVSINDDVTKTSLPSPKLITKVEDKSFAMKFYGLGSDGTVSANKSSIKIIGDIAAEKYIQGYFEYDSKKSGGLTISHLRVSENKIASHYLVNNADFIAIHNFTYVHQYDVLDGLKQGGNVLINTILTPEELENSLPNSFVDKIQAAKANLFIVDASKVAIAAGLGNRINVIMQSCFFKITNIVDFAKAEKQMRDSVVKLYSKKGEKIVEANMKAIDAATNDLIKIDVSKLKGECTGHSCAFNKKTNKYYNEWISKIEKRQGDCMRVSEFNASGTVPTATTQYEKRGINLVVPNWIKENCIECGKCSLVCPHAAIRATMLTKEELAKAPKTFMSKDMMGDKDGTQFSICVSVDDCTGCGSCANVCPGLKTQKALSMEEKTSHIDALRANWEFFTHFEPTVKSKFAPTTTKGAQFAKPYFEFSGACAGCGETPYVKLVTQLFGDRMIIANATGCSSIYGGAEPSSPYTTDKKGRGPSWGNSLFEDNAEFGLGIELGSTTRREKAYSTLASWIKDDCGASSEAKELGKKLLEAKDTNESGDIAEQFTSLLEKSKSCSTCQFLLDNKDAFSKKSVWIFGGDGWAYDIGFGGLDHVFASGRNVNILVLDTEVYSNTGGQASKSTPSGAIAKFAANGKSNRKKDLGLMAISYKDVYVAQVSMGSNEQQFITAVKEAESYNGVSLIIAYAPCISHGINMSKAQTEMKRAVDSGYWSLYTYDPRKEKPLTIQSKEPTLDYKEFLIGEGRYVQLMKKNPELADKLFEAGKQQAAERISLLKKIA